MIDDNYEDDDFADDDFVSDFGKLGLRKYIDYTSRRNQSRLVEARTKQNKFISKQIELKSREHSKAFCSI